MAVVVCAVVGGVFDELRERDGFEVINVNAGVIGLGDGLEEVVVGVTGVVMDVTIDEVCTMSATIPIKHGIVADGEVGAFAVAL